MLEEIFFVVVASLIVFLICWGLRVGYLELEDFSAMATLVDDFSIIRMKDEKILEQVRWDELNKVEILTTDDGPFVEDVFFLLHGEGENGCAVGQCEANGTELLSRLQELSGFDNEQLIAAMGSTQNARFLCWERPDAS